jgi:glycosyltransferase involved in cell wall biosynthesis
MRVIHIARFGGPVPGSFLAMVRALHHACDERGWPSELVLPPEAQGRDWYPALAAVMPIRTMVATRSCDELAALAGESSEPTLLHTHFTGYDLAAAAVRRARPGTGVVWHLHTRLDEGPVAVARNVAKFAIAGRGVGRIVCVGPDIAKSVRRRLARPGQVVVVPNGIDSSGFALAGEAERRAAKAALSVDPDLPLLLHFGWHWQWKGGDLFVQAAAELARRGVATRAVSVGAPVEEAQAAAAAASLDGSFSVWGETDQVRRLYAAADLLVVSSPVEGGPFSVLEALATGTPVVASPLGDAQIAGRVAACRVAERTPPAYADAIAATLDRSPEQAALEQRDARAYIESERDLTAWAARMADIYEQVMAGE